MKKIISFLKFTFFTTPKNASMWVEQNEKRITSLWSTLIFITTIAMLFVTIKNAFIK